MRYHIEAEAFNEYLQKTQEISISLLLSNEKQRKFSSKKYPAEFKEIDVDNFNNQQRALIIQFLQDIITMNNETLNESIKPLLIDFYQEIKNLRNEKHKGALLLLQKCGITEEFYEKQEEIENSEKLEENNELEEMDLFVNKAGINIQDSSPVKTPEKNLTTIRENSPKEEEKSSVKKLSTKKQQQSKKKENQQNLEELFGNDNLLFIEKHGLGLKNKGENDNNNTNSTKSLQKLGGANSKAIEELEKIRLKKLEEKLHKEMKAEEKKLKEELLRKKFREQQQKKNITLVTNPSVKFFFKKNPLNF